MLLLVMDSEPQLHISKRKNKCPIILGMYFETEEDYRELLEALNETKT